MLGRARRDAKAVAGGLRDAGERSGQPRSGRGYLEWSRMSWKQSTGSPRGSRPLGGVQGRRPGIMIVLAETAMSRRAGEMFRTLKEVAEYNNCDWSIRVILRDGDKSRN